MAGLNNIDAAIEQSLRETPPRPAPRNLYAKIRSRLAVAALVEQERQWLRQAAGLLGLLLAVAASLGAVLWILKGFLAPMMFRIPGAMGIMDYIVAGTLYSTQHLLGLFALLGACTVVAILLAFLLPRKTAAK